MFTWFDKALTSLIMPAIVAALASGTAMFGVTGTMDLQTFLTMIVTGAMTFLLPGIGKTFSGFITPAVVAAIMPIFGSICATCTGTMNWKTAVTMIATGLFTHMIPNKPAPKKA